jgi:ferrous iron transport protein A
MGLVRGTELKVIRLAPSGDPVEVLLKGYSLALERRR